MATDLGELRARLTMQAQQFQTGMQDARTQLERTGVSARQVSRDFGTIQRASLAVGGAMVAGIGASVATAANFEQAMAKVKAISGASAEEFNTLEKAARDAGATTVFSASEAAEALSYLAMAGFKVNDQVNALPAVLNAAAAGQIDLARSADIVSNIMTGFGISAENTGHAVDVLVKTMTSANTDLPMLGEAMKYVAPVAASLGLGIEETAAAVAKMSDAGIQGSQAGTSLRAALLSLANPAGQTEKAMDKLGIKVTNANGKMKPLPELIGHIAEKLEGMTDAQKTQTAAQLVGTEAASGFLSLLKIGEEGLKSYTNELKNSGGTAERIAKTQNDTLIGSFKEFQSALEEAGITLGNEFLPLFTEIVRKGTEVVRIITDLDMATIKSGLAFAGATTAIALTASTIGKLVLAIRGLMISMGPAGWLITSLSVIGGLFAATAISQNELRKVSLENVEAMEQQRDSLAKNIEAFDGLSQKSKLSADEMARFVDINSLLSQTADPEIIAALKDEQEKLREKSGLSNDELQRMIDLNGKILEVVPESNTTLTDQGNVLLDNTSAAKEFNAEQMEMIRLELEAQQAKAEANMAQYLTDEKRLLQEMKQLKTDMNGLDKEEQEQRRIIGSLESELAAAKRNNDDSEISKLTLKLGVENQKLQKMKEQRAESAELILKKQQEIDKIQTEIGKLDEVKRKMVDIELKQVGINAKRGEEMRALDSAISKLETQKQKLQNNTPAAERNTEEYRRSVGAIQSQIDNLNSVKNRISEITGQAQSMNRTIGSTIYKDIVIREKRYGLVTTPGQSGRVPEGLYHTGGIVGRGQMPKLHTGGLASQFMNAPLHNEIDVRLLRNEMVLTEAQQANLMRMIDAGFANSNSPDFSPEVIEILREIERGITNGLNATIILDGREAAMAVDPHLKELQQNREFAHLKFRGENL